ncbi:MAG: hypothetical protein NC187_03210 [Candidatus Amulumruptor caecigallinarius]|nr:hypothetical protein [Candidatus Amulumruptor caecigallinarius]MCM1396484.1 hypothetical protein [Candidatus Amulumruptor caecigallinarius]MCM1453459.1 hypothetical protein [bacterium]
MKKLLLVVAIAIAATTYSCSGTKRAEDKGADLKTKIENCTDPDSLKVYVQQAREYAEKMIAEGKDSEAKAYLDEVIPAVTAKDPSLVSNLVTEADSAATAIKEAKDSVAAKAGELKDSMVSKAGQTVDAAKGAVSAAAQTGADKVKDAASTAKDKASDAISGAADKVKDAVGANN